jgi:alpha-glucoside transport system substrate-binding protein
MQGKDGTRALYAFPYKIDVKSLVWYVPENFEDAGYEVPADHGRPEGADRADRRRWRHALVHRPGFGRRDRLAGDRLGRGHDAAHQPADVYDKWVTHEIPFNDPAVVAAIEEFGWFAKNDAFVAGGARGRRLDRLPRQPQGPVLVAAAVLHAPSGVSFIPSFFPEGTVVGQDADFFYMPAYAGKDLGKPVLGAGTLAFITKDTEAARAFIEWLKTPIAHEVWMAQSGFLTPLKGANPRPMAATSPQDGRHPAERDDLPLRRLGPDAGRGRCAGTFWTGMVDYVGGKSAQEVADAIEASWPK